MGTARARGARGGGGSAGVKTELGGNGLIIINYDNELVS